jgi:hypothetical protein
MIRARVSHGMSPPVLESYAHGSGYACQKNSHQRVQSTVHLVDTEFLKPLHNGRVTMWFVVCVLYYFGRK